MSYDEIVTALKAINDNEVVVPKMSDIQLFFGARAKINVCIKAEETAREERMRKKLGL